MLSSKSPLAKGRADRLTSDQKWLEELYVKNQGDSMTNKEVNATKRSLAWRWPWVIMVFLTVTVFCLCWVKVSSIMANKDVRIQQIQTLKQ